MRPALRMRACVVRSQHGPPDRPPRTVRSWPLLVLAVPAAAEVWSGWVGIAQKTGFGLVSPLPGIWPSLHLDTAITLPVLVLGMGTALAHMLRADAETMDAPEGRTSNQPSCGPPSLSPKDRAGPSRRRPQADQDRSGRRDQDAPVRRPEHPGARGEGSRPAQPQQDQARLVACKLAAAGKPVSRRALRSGGVRGSNEALNALVGTINAELAGIAGG